MKDKPNYYATIPADVRYDNTLTPNAKLLYAEITALSNMNGRCNASSRYFADLYNVSRVSIQKWLKLLEDKKYINREIIYKQGCKQIEKRYITLVNNPCKEKLTDNTNINITNNNITYSNKVHFKKPTLDEVKNYCLERNNNIDAEAFIAYYESKGWMVGSGKMKKWKAAIIIWEKKNYNQPKGMGKLHSQINEWQEAKKLL